MNTNVIIPNRFQGQVKPSRPRLVPARVPQQFKQWNRWDDAPLAKLRQEQRRASRLLSYLPKKIERARKLELSHLTADLESRLARAKINYEVLTNKIDLRTGAPVVAPEKFLGRGARERLAAAKLLKDKEAA